MASTKNIIKPILFLVSLLLFLGVRAQEFSLNGSVSGYGTKDVKFLKKLKKDVHFEGLLKGVKVSASSNGFSRSAYTGLDGSYNLVLPTGRKYTIKYNKKGYSILTFYVNSKANSGSIYGLSPVLQNEDNNSYNIGSFTVSSKWVSFKKSNTQESSLKNSNAEMAAKSAKISNIENKKNGNVVMEEEEFLEDTIEMVEVADEPNEITTYTEQIASVLALDSLPDQKIAELEEIINQAKEELEGLDENSLEYKKLMIEINLAEQKLEDAKEIIKLKNQKLSEHQQVIIYLSLFLVALLIIGGLVYYFYVQIRDKNEEITEKSERIQNSLEYAALIQKALLKEENPITNTFTNSFLLYQPKDVVSGDFYWHREIDGKKIVVASDCTGHGVPGALLTMLGVSALEEIIVEDKIFSPSKILLELDKSFGDKLKDNNPYQLNGMDIFIAVYDEKISTLTYNGAMRDATLIRDGKSEFLKPELASIASGRLKDNISDKEVKVQSGEFLFLYSDGFQDQFKGDLEKVETYNYPRFKDLLIKASNSSDFKANRKELEKELNSWKGQREQTDDVLIIGIKF